MSQVLDYESTSGQEVEPHRSVLHVPLDDPFFFDHALDHVPGMLLIHALLDDVRRLRPPRTWGRVSLDFTFTRFCGLEATTELHVSPQHPPAPWTLSTTQAGQPVCVARLQFGVPGSPPARQAGDANTPVRVSDVPVARALTHRRRLENVMLGKPITDQGVVSSAVLLPRSGHTLDPRLHPDMSSEWVIEAGRQLTTFVMVGDAEDPLGVQLIFLKLQAEIPSAFEPGTQLILRCSPPKQLPWEEEVAVRVSLHERHTGEELGWLVYSNMRVTSTFYRENLRSAAETAKS